MMYTSKLFTQAVDYQKAMFDTSFSMMRSFQDQGHKIMDMAVDTNPLFPDGTKKICTYWLDFAKQNRENCKEYIDSGYDRLKEFIASSGPVSGPAKTGKKTK